MTASGYGRSATTTLCWFRASDICHILELTTRWWVVERSFAWLSRYRRLNTIFERSKGHLIVFVSIVFISILSRRMTRLVTKEMSTWRLQTASKYFPTLSFA